MTVDEPTLMTVLGMGSLTASAMFFALAAFARQIPGVRYWACASLTVGFATVLDGPRLVEDWRLASLLFNIPFTVGQIFTLAGTMQFCGRPGATRILWVLSAIAVILTVLFTYIIPDTSIRVGTLSTYQTMVNLWTAYILWRYPDAFSRRMFTFACLVALVQAAAALAQGILIGSSSLAMTYATPEYPLANIISWAGATSNVLVGNWILFLLIMLRLVADLRLAAERDALTSLLNRRGLRLHIDSILRRANGGGGVLGVMILDIDHFKVVNDSHGHDLGDKVLVMMGEVLLGMNLPNTTPCRWGGEEFCIIVEGPTRASLVAIAEQVRSQFRLKSATLAALPDGCTVSIGVATSSLDAAFEMSGVISRADVELYRAKESGRNCVCLAE
ncbi:MAG: GGDEF domain-containing protein [Massilia sp.]